MLRAHAGCTLHLLRHRKSAVAQLVLTHGESFLTKRVKESTADSQAKTGWRSCVILLLIWRPSGENPNPIMRACVCLAVTRALGSIGYPYMSSRKTLREKTSRIPKECRCSSVGEARKSQRETEYSLGPLLATESGNHKISRIRGDPQRSDTLGT